MLNKFLTALFGVAVFIFIITFSIGLPIYCRFFYYMQIETLNIPEVTRQDYSTIKAAYDQILDFLTLPNREFGAGVFSYTDTAEAHFYDCKALFNLNAVALIISSIIIVTIITLNKLKVISLKKPFRMSVSFISSISIFVFFLLLAFIVALDFTAAFTVFHKIFFAGKANWLFDPRRDGFINILPENFFMNCAILIASSIIIISISIIVYQLIKKRKNARKDAEIE